MKMENVTDTQCCWNEGKQEFYPIVCMNGKWKCEGCNHKIKENEEEAYKKQMKKIMDMYKDEYKKCGL